MLREPGGEPVVYGWRTPGHHWLEFPGAAKISIDASTRSLVAFPDPSAAHDDVVEACYTAWPLAMQILGFEALHASASKIGAGVVAFCAESGTGKTTLAFALGRSGHAFWSDDAVVFDVAAAEGVIAQPVPFRINLRAASKSALGLDDQEVLLHAADFRSVRAPAQLNAVAILEREPSLGSAAELLSLSPGDALAALLPHGHRFTLEDPQVKRRTIESYLALVEQVPVFLLAFRPGFVWLDDVVAVVEQAFGARVAE